MKKRIYLRYFYAYLLLMGLGAALTLVLMLWHHPQQSPYEALTLVPMAACAYCIGKRLCATNDENTAWNAAIAVYAVSLAFLLLSWSYPESKTAAAALVWNLPSQPPLFGFDALIGDRISEGGDGYYALYRSTRQYKTLVLPLMQALLAAAPPLCLTLGALRAKAAGEKAPAQSESNETSKEER